MTNFSGIRRQGLWSWLTPERAVLVVPVFAGLGLSMALLSVVVTPLTIRVRDQNEVVEQLTTKAEFLPVLRQQLAAVKREQVERVQQLDRLLELVAGTSELQTFLAGLNDLARVHSVAITTTKPGEVERFKTLTPAQAQEAPPAAGGGNSGVAAVDPLLNRGLEKRSATLTVTGPFQQVLAFLRSLEQLEVFVVISEMNIRGQGGQSEDGVDQAEVEMELTLSAYGLQPVPPAQSAENSN
ncbi:hypothetical protein [Synechococcus sp. MU1617]|uniref:hypothetical protein n=1 Tax=Synechococcus sp. MU1617 TaxID=2508346 RepID=UPI001CF8108F|nr:hypothetical protein [Synechococcus sp. MU1617]MCB4389105.1 hypothetical protein [Synechococcus sp. MU1617]